MDDMEFDIDVELVGRMCAPIFPQIGPGRSIPPLSFPIPPFSPFANVTCFRPIILYPGLVSEYFDTPAEL